MFLLKAPTETMLSDHAEGNVQVWELATKGEYATLDDAIEAAIKSDLDLEASFIERDCVLHSVNHWIACRVAGGLCDAG